MTVLPYLVVYHIFGGVTSLKKLRVVRGVDAPNDYITNAYLLDIDVFPEQYLMESDTFVELFNSSKESHFFLVDGDEEDVVGYWNHYFVSDSAVKSIISGDFIESSLAVSDIINPSNEGGYALLISSMVVSEKYLNTKAFTMLYDEFMKYIIELANKGVFVNKVFAEGVLKKGARMCRLSGMETITSNIYGEPIYALLDTNNFKPLGSLAAKVKEFYTNRNGVVDK